jgi:hypothetical protein
MSAQGGTLQRRGTIELPILPVAVLVVAALAAAIGMTLLRDAGQTQTRLVTSVTDTERFANSTAAVREQGAVAPAIVGISHVAPSLHSESATYGTGWDSIGGQNEALHRQYSPPQEGAAPAPVWGPIMVNGEPCMQCR